MLTAELPPQRATQLPEQLASSACALRGMTARLAPDLSSSTRASLLPRERARQPVEALVKAVARRRTGRLDVPIAVAHLLKAKLVRHLQILNVTNALRPQIEYEITVPHVQQTTRGRAVESESDLGGGHRLRKILLVGEDLACLVLEM